jgi:hypothetical protein
MFKKMTAEEKIARKELNKKRYKYGKNLDAKKPKKDDIIDDKIFVPVKKINLVNILSDLNIRQLQYLSYKAELPIAILKSLRMGLYEPTEKVENNLIYCLKEMKIIVDINNKVFNNSYIQFSSSHKKLDKNSKEKR